MNKLDNQIIRSANPNKYGSRYGALHPMPAAAWKKESGFGLVIFIRLH